MNILESLQPLTHEPALGTLGRLTGGDEGSTRRGLEAAFPAAVLGLADHASSPEGSRQLSEHLRRGDSPTLDASMLDNMATNPAAADRVIEEGTPFLQRLFGDRQPGLMDAIAGHAGMSRMGTSRLMGLAMPLVMGVLGRHLLSGGLDAGGLGRYLGQQRLLASAALPGPLRGFFGVGGARRDEAYGELRERGPRTTEVTRRHRRGSLLPWAIVALALLLGIGWLLSRADHGSAVRTATAPTRDQPAAQAEQIPREEVRPVSGDAAIADMTRFLDSHASGTKRVVLTGVTFPGGVSVVPSEAAPILNQLATQLKNHPRARAQVRGYADPSGTSEANQQLSTQRAEAVKNYLVLNQGVDADRVDAIGEGTAAGAAGTGRHVDVVLTVR